MLHLIDNQKMRVVATSPDIAFLEDHARDLPQFTDFMIIEAKKHHLVAFNVDNLWALYRNLGGQRNPGRYDRNQLETLVVSSLAGLEPVSEPPSAKAERHTIIPDGHYPNGDSLEDRRNEMATAKKTASKKASAKPSTKKTSAKKAAPKKSPAKKAAPKAPKVERVKQNGVAQPKEGTVTHAIFTLADEISKKAEAPASRSDVLAACAEKGIKPGSATSGYQLWRRFHGLVKA